MFPFFPFGPVPPIPFLLPFQVMSGMMGSGMMGSGMMGSGMFGAWPGARTADDSNADGHDTTGSIPFGVGAPASLMSMAMMPAMAPFAFSSHLARAVEDAGHVAAQVRDSLERDDGPVHVMVGDPDGPLGLAIGLTFMTRGQRPALADTPAAPTAPRLAGMVDVTPEAPAA